MKGEIIFFTVLIILEVMAFIVNRKNYKKYDDEIKRLEKENENLRNEVMKERFEEVVTLEME